MDAVAAVMTGPGAAAIATILLHGPSAEIILREVFKPAGSPPCDFEAGRILLGHIVDGTATIDQVTIGCEASGQFTIHCHGNPMIVQAIMALLRDQGAQLLTADQLCTRALSAGHASSSIAVEAGLALATVKTLDGARIIAGQIDAGLSRLARDWQQHIDSMSLAELAAQTRQVLDSSRAARLIISGCKIALIGPPNTGKSTLLNALAGRDKAITADVKGTTRDWVSAEIHIPPLAATVIDTAGLDFDDVHSEVDQAAQAKTVQMLDEADLILVVLDNTRPATQLADTLLDQLADKHILPVLNKIDLPSRLETTHLPSHLAPPIPISAAHTTGLEDLIPAIHDQLGVTDFNPQTSVAFTSRQQALLERLTAADTSADAATVITEILHGPVRTRS